jgi:hypothetical protein
MASGTAGRRRENPWPSPHASLSDARLGAVGPHRLELRGRRAAAAAVASSDSRASQVDEVQYGHQDGPCLRSLATGEVLGVDDLAQDDRWGGYRMPALGHGVRSSLSLSLSLPLRGDGEVIGALNIYATTPREFGPPEQLIAGRFADEASRALALAVRMAERTEMSAHLQNALASRAVIDQALGIIMGQNRCTADEAFEVLRSISQNRNIKLRDIAADMITAVSGRPPGTPPASPDPPTAPLAAAGASRAARQVGVASTSVPQRGLSVTRVRGGPCPRRMLTPRARRRPLPGRRVRRRSCR